ncbi:MAG: helix-turn-helix domain-containing protein [Phycisphaerales bacterium]|nr:helix-turn-helix domain-containing protein [Phycisphaerales bacterium]MCB9855193.1 helix-turn-helix domain-containing protein [Phycisphaerales bacterium]MCB9862786.1 helix-turn-helix domain-containing protein [Phycisphaerales bacterium]
MPGFTTDHLLDHARRSPLLARIRDYGAAVAGIYLTVLVRRGDEVVELDLNGSEAEVPEFCHVIRQTDEGLRRCKACRSLIAFGACYRGMSEFQCHGGVSVLAAPARRPESNAKNCIVVSSCAFASGSTANGWRRAKSHAKGLSVNLKTLRQAYHALPCVDEDRLRLAGAFVQLAATALTEAEQLLTLKVRTSGRGDLQPADCCAPPDGDDFAALLRLSQVAADDSGNAGACASLADLIKAMIERDPAMPFTIAKIAKAARLSPNHLSTLFHQQTGETFTDYLTGQRIKLAKRLLTDPTLSVKEVAQRAGFTDPAYFTRRFKSATAKTPTQWRDTI